MGLLLTWEQLRKGSLLEKTSTEVSKTKNQTGKIRTEYLRFILQFCVMRIPKEERDKGKRKDLKINDT